MAKTEVRLKVRTRALAIPHQISGQGDFSLLNHLPENPLTFIRDNQGLVGRGEVARLSALGENRFAELQAQWAELVANAEIDDAVDGIGRGLIAFATVTFDDQSAKESVLVVPEAILGVRDDRAWITQIWVAEQPEPAELTSLDAFCKVVATSLSSEPVNLVEGETSAAQFETLVESAVEKLTSGEVEKVVLARDLKGRLGDGFDLRVPLIRLAKRYENCWTYSVDGLFGASPELLVRVSHSQVSARVLAGTASRGTDPQIDRAIADALLTSNKNKREHAFAVESLVASLKQYCVSIAADVEPFSLALPNLWHLASDVTAVLREDKSSLDLAGALHPTAAVAGTPTQSALRVIKELEQQDRGRYAGPVGWIGANGDGEWAIALRGAQISKDAVGEKTVRAFAGCGIVVGSEPAAELAETELKFQPIRYALA